MRQDGFAREQRREKKNDREKSIAAENIADCQLVVTEFHRGKARGNLRQRRHCGENRGTKDNAAHAHALRDRLAGLLQDNARDQCRHRGDGKYNRCLRGAEFFRVGLFLFLSHCSAPLPARRIAVALPGKAVARFADEINAGNPYAADQHIIGRDPVPNEGARQLMTHNGKGQDRDHEHAFEHEIKRGGAVSERRAFAQAKRIKDHKHDGLDGDAAQDISRGQAKLIAHRATRRDRDLGQVRDNR